MSKAGNKYEVTTAQTDDGTLCEGFGHEFDIGDQVEVFFHYNRIKMRRGKP